MQLYHGTYLRDYKFTIPKELFNNGSFFKYHKLNVYEIIKKDFNPNESDTSDAIQIFITPYEYNELENIYLFELTMPNVKRAFDDFLQKLTNDDVNVNILDCKAVDTAKDSKNESIGKVDFIAKYANQLSIDDKRKQINNIENELQTRHGENALIKLTRSFENQSIIDPNEYDIKFRYSLLEKDIEKVKKGDNGYVVDFNHTNWKDLKGKIEEWNDDDDYYHCNYLSITSFSEGNFITIKFKSFEEVTVPLQITFKNNKKGVLRDIIKSLGDIGVNMKLIDPLKLNEKPIYRIYFDIANTKLAIFNKANIKKLLIKIINSADIEKIEYYNPKDFTPSGKNYLSSNDIISESDKKFRTHIKSVFEGEYLENFKKHCLNNSCKNEDCFLRVATRTRREFEALLVKIENSINGNSAVFSDLKGAIHNLKSNLPSQRFDSLHENCGYEIKQQLKELYTQIEKYINGDFSIEMPNLQIKEEDKYAGI